MRDAITLRNIHNSHLKPRYTKDIPTRVCAECAQAHARNGAILALATLALGAPHSLRSPSQDPRARYARARCPPFPPFPLPIPSVPPPNSLRSPSNSRARSARLGFLPPTHGGNPRAPSSGQGKRLRNRISTSLSPPFPPFPLEAYGLPRARVSRGL